MNAILPAILAHGVKDIEIPLQNAALSTNAQGYMMQR
jgi:hypothetical protein